jgi:Holliday junction resolvase-like predicted endonuclease
MHESGASLDEVQDFFLPLLKDNEVEGSLEVRCPKCDSEMGTYRTYPSIPEKMYCEFCETSFEKTSECLDIIIEIKKKLRFQCKDKLDLMNRKITPNEFKEILKDALTDSNRISKGKKFENFLANFIAQQSGFNFLRRHARSKVGEIDYLYRVSYNDHPLWNSFNYIFIECKNWKKTIPSKELSHFLALLKRKSIFRCFGIYLTTSKLSPEALETLKTNEGLVIIVIERKKLSEMINLGFKTFLQEEFEGMISKA